MPLLIEFGVLTGVSCWGAARGIGGCLRGEFLVLQARISAEIPSEEEQALAFLLLERVSQASRASGTPV
jgi:hypothetical protein